eukprot:s61_g31.t1
MGLNDTVCFLDGNGLDGHQLSDFRFSPFGGQQTRPMSSADVVSRSLDNRLGHSSESFATSCVAQIRGKFSEPHG